MSLRKKMLTLALVTLLVPWFGFQLVQELEQYLREDDANALAGAARTMARALPEPFLTALQAPADQLPLRKLTREPTLDGYHNDWSQPDISTRFTAPDGSPQLDLMAGRYGRQDYLFLQVADPTPGRRQAAGTEANRAGADHVLLYLRDARGLRQFRIQAAAPGPLLVSSQSPGGGQLQGYWLDTPAGYALELALPPLTASSALSLAAVDVQPDSAGVERRGEAGTLQAGRPRTWLHPLPSHEALQDWLEAVAPPRARAWLVDGNGWVRADTGPRHEAAQESPAWLERVLYRLLVSQQMDRSPARSEHQLRSTEALVQEALAGSSAQVWSGDSYTAAIRNTVAEPISQGGVTWGSVVLEADTDGALLFANRTLGRLLLVSLLLMVLLVAGIWLLSTRLSRRVLSLSTAVSEAMDDQGAEPKLPLVGDEDELGQLARNNERLLRSVKDYNRYLQQLAGRLSHELKTPLAITRSSLENLASQPLAAEAMPYLERAREGLDRQTALVRAMSEATRLETAVRTADWTRIDLSELLRGALEGYRSIYPHRRFELTGTEQPLSYHCAPDLLVQALDKLVDNAVSLTASDALVTIGLAQHEHDLCLSVSNGGSRLPEQFQDQLFDALMSVRDPAAGGTHLGLGLYIVRLVAEAHEGQVQAENLPAGAGVRFSLVLPRN